MEKCIYYGAGEFARDNFKDLSQRYEPFCFCDRAASPGMELFDLPVLPPSAVFEQYPEAPILITVAPHNILDVQGWLTEELGVSENRILNYKSEPYKEVLSCWYLEEKVIICLWEDNVSLLLCCGRKYGHNNIPCFDRQHDDSPHEMVEALQRMKERIKISLIQGESCECDGCPGLSVRNVSMSKQPIRFLEFRFNNRCNLRCSYCITNRTEVPEIDIKLMRDLVNAAKKTELIDSFTSISLATSGEITIHPQRAEIFSLIHDSNCMVFSNCTIYDKSFAEHLEFGKTTINCSVDAGTRETYISVKGADYFEEVCQNLILYSKTAKIELKYVFLPGVNDNEADIDGFIQLIDDICKNKNLNCVCISKDFTNSNDKPELGNHTMTMMARLLYNCKKRSVAVQIYDVFSNDERARFAEMIEERNLV
jgi:pyruvate-formate lyase-activating enzyme